MSKRRFLLLFLITIGILPLNAQTVIPFLDFNNFFQSFEDGGFKVIEMQPVKSFQAGDELVAYLDTRGNLRVYDGKQRKDITNLNVSYQVSDHLMGYMIGPTLNMWDNGRLQTLTYFGRRFVVKDSLIVYDDTRFNTLNVYWKKQTETLATIIGEVTIPASIGEDMIVFKDNGNLYKVFHDGNTQEICAWNGNIDFQIGTQILCFNDPTTQTFVVYENGQFSDVEGQFMRKYKAGRGFIVYEDLNANLWLYKNGVKTLLTNFLPSFWEVKDDIVVWGENSYFFTYVNDEKKQVCNYIPERWEIKNNTIAYRNVVGGVSAMVNGFNHEITMMPDSEFFLYGNSVLVKLFNNSHLVLSNGKVFSN
ncbi:MAG: hypothetical protein ACO28O_02680 [Crocinitomicaceae bacterium]